MSEIYDLIVIGGGTVGLSAVQTAATAGEKVLLISEGPLGGECTWNGCVPSKALIDAARVHTEVLKASLYGITASNVSVDFRKVIERVHSVVNSIAATENDEKISQLGVTVLHGIARLTASNVVSVDNTEFQTRATIIATGSRPSIPPIPGLKDVPYHTNESIFTLSTLPQRLIIIGAGPIGLELGQAFSQLGSAVTILDSAPHLLPREDADIAAIAHKELVNSGIHFLLGASIEQVLYDGSVYSLSASTDAGSHSIAGDVVLVATGRSPNISNLSLQELGISTTPHGISVDETLQTNVPSIFAAGDVTGILPFTHVAAYHGRIAAHNALSNRKRKASYRVIPWIIFTSPEIAHVGMTEEEAVAAHGKNVRVASIPFAEVDRAVIAGETIGLIKVITSSKPIIGHTGGGEILGAHIIGPNAGELIHEFVIGMHIHAFAGRLAQAIHAYPSMSIGVQQAVAQLFKSGN